VTPADLKTALAKCVGGETVDLGGASLGKVQLKSLTFAEPVTIANGSLSFDVRASSGLTFDQVALGTSLAGYGSSRIGVRRSIISSTDGIALSFVGIADGFVEESEFADVILALAVRNCTRFHATDSKFHRVTKDGVRVQEGCDTVRIASNDFWDFHLSAVEHQDAIQVIADARPTRGLTIKDNNIWRGEGSAVQGIFCQGKTGGLPFERLVIRRNWLEGTMPNAIMASGDYLVERNVVRALGGDKAWIRLSGTGVERSNMAPAYLVAGKLVSA